MNHDPNRAEEQAERDRVPGLDVVLEAVMIHLPALQTYNTQMLTSSSAFRDGI
jgi:hypothetical protein